MTQFNENNMKEDGKKRWPSKLNSSANKIITNGKGFNQRKILTFLTTCMEVKSTMAEDLGWLQLDHKCLWQAVLCSSLIITAMLDIRWVTMRIVYKRNLTQTTNSWRSRRTWIRLLTLTRRWLPLSFTTSKRYSSLSKKLRNAKMSSLLNQTLIYSCFTINSTTIILIKYSLLTSSKYH